jgi:hypothetical protein
MLSSENVDQLDVGVSEQPRGTDPYAAVGGLDEQIAQIRDLIEIPLRRPELFRHFRECKGYVVTAARPRSYACRPQTPARVAPSWPTWDWKDAPCARNLCLDGLVSAHGQRT